MDAYRRARRCLTSSKESNKTNKDDGDDHYGGAAVSATGDAAEWQRSNETSRWTGSSTNLNVGPASVSSAARTDRPLRSRCVAGKGKANNAARSVGASLGDETKYPVPRRTIPTAPPTVVTMDPNGAMTGAARRSFSPTVLMGAKLVYRPMTSADSA